MSQLITLSRLREIIAYDPHTGVMTWKVRPSSRALAGQPVGTLSLSRGYIKTEIGGKCYQLHRLIWFHYYGVWPCGIIDHINGKKTDNRIENLREADPSQNCVNRSISTRNTSGSKWVCWNKAIRKWQVQMHHRGKSHYVGVFEDMEDAKREADAYARNLFGEFFSNRRSS